MSPADPAALRDALTEGLRADGVLADPRWIAAFRAVPRHVFLPRFFVPAPGDGSGRWWSAVRRGDPGWLRLVYADRVLVTQLDDDPAAWRRARRHGGPVSGVPTSSSSMPTIMAVMLEELRVTDGHRVLEVGTGTGYNAALLCHRLGDQLVSTVDIDSGLVDSARMALARTGYRPACEVADGARGYPPNAPYDRLLSTCAVSVIPEAWLSRVRPGGLILTTLNRPIGAGLVRITVHGDGTADGRVLARDGRFMPMRAHRLPEFPAESAGREYTRDTTLGADVLDPGHPFEFFAGFPLAGAIAGWSDPDTLMLAHPDGSWARYRDGTVTQAGCRRLWDRLEQGHREWLRLGAPARDRFGVRIAGRRQEIWLDAEHGWPLAGG